MKTINLLIIANLFLVVGCTAQGPRPDEDSAVKIAAELDEMSLQTTQKPVRIRDYQIRSWRYIDRYNLIIEAGFKDHYLVSLHSPCLGLRGAFAIGITSSAGSVDKFEDIIVKSGGRNGIEERCHIQEIVKLEPIPSESAESVE